MQSEQEMSPLLLGGQLFAEGKSAKLKPSHEDRVRQMMQGFGQECPTSPTVSDYKTRELRVRLMLEEVMEYAEAAGVEVQVSDGYGGAGYLGVDFKDFRFGASPKEPNIVEMSDALADISVTCVGSFVAHSLPMDALLEEVDASNLRKFDGGYKDENGKFRKPANWKPPHIERVLLDHGWKPDNEPMKEDAPPS